MQKLTFDAVDTLIKECLAPAEFDGAVATVDGLVHKFNFDRAKIEENKPKILALLAELPDPFHSDKGGGWSFLNGCQDRNGDQWTGLHLAVEQLVCLGIAAGAAAWMMKDMADVLPGGMPYFQVTV